MTNLNDNFIKLYQKAEKLSSAVFMVSNIMSDCEDLKNNIRHLALELISTGVQLKDGLSDNNFKSTLALEAVTLKLMSFLEIAFVSGMISEMNSRILKEEFKGFLSIIQHYSMSYYSPVENLLKNSQFEKSVGDKGLLEVSGNTGLSLSQNGPINTSINKSQNTKNHKLSRRESRGRNIMDFIAHKDYVSIKDIVQSVKGCSEKTIQRELSKLIKEGLIKREGERRWTRYSAV